MACACVVGLLAAAALTTSILISGRSGKTAPDAQVETEEPVAQISQRLVDASADSTACIVDGRLRLAGALAQDCADALAWTQLCQVSVGDGHILALDGDGRVWATGNNHMGQCAPDGMTGAIVALAGDMCSVLVRSDGTLGIYGATGSEWRRAEREESGVRDADVSSTHLVVLRADGSAAAYAVDGEDALDLSRWSGITAVSAGNGFCVGVRADGSVLFEGADAQGASACAQWRDMADAVAGGGYVVGLDREGGVRAAGSNASGQCNVQGWENVLAVSAGYDHTVALVKDGSILTAGYDGDGQCSAWEGSAL